MQEHLYAASDLKARAREAIRTNPSTLAMIVFLASLPGLIGTTVSYVTHSADLTGKLYSMMMNATSNEAIMTLTNRIADMYLTHYQSIPGIISLTVDILALLVTPMLSLGLVASLLKLLRGENVTSADVLCRGRYFFKAIGLQLLTHLKILLWLLPGVAVCILSAFVLFWTRSVAFYIILFLLGLGVMLVLGLRATLHYVLAEQIMADDPTTGIRTAIHESIGCMRTRKMAFAMLYLSFIGWYLVSNLAQSVMMNISSVLGLVVGMIFSLFLNLYINTAVSAFYMKEYRGEEPASAAKKEAGDVL